MSAPQLPPRTSHTSCKNVEMCVRVGVLCGELAHHSHQLSSVQYYNTSKIERDSLRAALAFTPFERPHVPLEGVEPEASRGSTYYYESSAALSSAL